MISTQLDLLRSIIQEEIYLILETQKVERSFKVEQEHLNQMWRAFKETF
jgi:hypothetical protein